MFFARGLVVTFRPPERGRRESRAHDAPAASRANKIKHTSVVTTGSPERPGLPCAMVLTATSCSPRSSGFLVSVAGEIASANLTPASRRQDHTTLPSAENAFAVGTLNVHRIPRP